MAWNPADLGLEGQFVRTSDALLVIEVATDRVVLANPVALELLDVSSATGGDRSFDDLFPPASRAEARRAREAFLEEGASPPHARCHVQRADGSTFPCEWYGWTRLVGEQRALVLSIRDLSEQARAIEEIHLRNVAISSVSSGVTIADARLPDLPLIYVNRGFEQITGYRAREAVGRSCRFLQGTDRAQPDLDVLRKALREGQACEVRLRNYRKNGERFWNELHISPVRDDEGTLTHFVGIQIDVTDRVESRQRLEESEERYRTLAESIEDLVVRTSRDGVIQFLSPSFRRHTGCDPAEWIGRRFTELLHPEERDPFSRQLHALERSHPSAQHSFRIRDRDGEEAWMEATSNLVSEAHREPYIVSVVRDVTLRRKAEGDIRVALERERELNIIKTGFIRMVSHEFRTPMTGIGASTAFLSQYGDSLPAEKRERHFQNIERSLRRMNQLLDDVLFVSRSDSGRVPFETEPVVVRELSEQLIEEMLAAHPERAITLDSSLSDTATFALDPNLVHHVIQNLLGNALKYSPSEKSVRLGLELVEDGNILQWSVRDEGIGIPKRDRERLFEPFQRAGNVSTVCGTGLGLYIAKRSAELHDGTLDFQSTEGRGSEFFLRLPAHPIAHPEISHAQ